MTLERILQAAVNDLAAGRREAHSYSAHVPGKGYVNDGTILDTRADYLRQLAQSVRSEVDNINWAPSYAEPGYTDSPKGVLWANWNVFPRDFDRILERAGYTVEWSDEWSTCDGCNRAVRTSPDSYQYQPFYVLMNDCEIVCLDCVDWPDYLESIEDNPDMAVIAECYPGKYGYHRVSDSEAYENGFHPGQDDNPATILKALHAAGREHIVFRIPETSQFYIRFETWQRNADEDQS